MILTFKQQFVEPIKDGDKGHTMRFGQKRKWRPGMQIHMRSGKDRYHTEQFAEFPCLAVRRVTVRLRLVEKSRYGLRIDVDGLTLSDEQERQLLQNDGFASVAEAVNFFFPKHVRVMEKTGSLYADEPATLDGVLIAWKDYAYCPAQIFTPVSVEEIDEQTAKDCDTYGRFFVMRSSSIPCWLGDDRWDEDDALQFKTREEAEEAVRKSPHVTLEP